MNDFMYLSRVDNLSCNMGLLENTGEHVWERFPEGSLLPVPPRDYSVNPPDQPEIEQVASRISLPDTFIDNPGGALDCFDGRTSLPSGHLHTISGGPEGPYPQWRKEGPDPSWHIGEYLWPKVDRLEEYLQWAEERAALNGIIPPYKQADFSPLTEAMPTNDVDMEDEVEEMEDELASAEHALDDLGPLHAHV